MLVMQRVSKRCNQSYAGFASQVRIMRAWTYHFLTWRIMKLVIFQFLLNLVELNSCDTCSCSWSRLDRNSDKAYGNGGGGKIFTSNWQKIAKMAKSYKKLPIHACSYWTRLKRVLLGFARGFFCWKAKEILYKYVAIWYGLMDPPTLNERNNV